MLYIVTDFSFYMLPGATKGSFEFEQIDREEVKKLLKENKYKVYIREKEKIEAEAVKKDLNITFEMKRAYPHDFYEYDKLILVRNSSNNIFKYKPQYFYCTIHSNGHPEGFLPEDRILVYGN